MRLIVPFFLFALALPISAHAQEPPPAYQALVDQAVAEFGAEHWAEARALFEQAHQLFPNARTLRGLGMATFELRDYPASVLYLTAALSEQQRALTAELRTSANELLTRAQGFVGRYVVPAAPEGSRLFVDNEAAELAGWPAAATPLVLAIGAHTIAIRVEGRSTEARVRVAGRENAPLEIDLAPLSPPQEPLEDELATPEPTPPPAEESLAAPPEAPPPETGPPAAAWVIGGLGAAAMIGGTVMLAVGLSDIGDVEDAPARTEWSTLSSANDRAPLFTGVGGALVGVGSAAVIGAIVWIMSSESHERDAVSVQASLGPGQGSLGVEGVW